MRKDKGKTIEKSTDNEEQQPDYVLAFAVCEFCGNIHKTLEERLDCCPGLESWH